MKTLDDFFDWKQPLFRMYFITLQFYFAADFGNHVLQWIGL